MDTAEITYARNGVTTTTKIAGFVIDNAANPAELIGSEVLAAQKAVRRNHPSGEYEQKRVIGTVTYKGANGEGMGFTITD